VLVRDLQGSGRQDLQTYTIFEGTSEIQRLIISRAISGVHIK
jgi:acyl-CoA dehydrogenase